MLIYLYLSGALGPRFWFQGFIGFTVLRVKRLKRSPLKFFLQFSFVVSQVVTTGWLLCSVKQRKTN